MIWARPHAKGSMLLLYIQPGASRSEICGVHGDRLKLKIKAPPRDGEANEALVDFIAATFSLPKTKVHLIRGETSRRKDVLVELSIETVKNLTLSIT